MAWIRIIRESEATGKLKKMYDKLIEPWGGVDFCPLKLGLIHLVVR